MRIRLFYLSYIVFLFSLYHQTFHAQNILLHSYSRFLLWYYHCHLHHHQLLHLFHLLSVLLTDTQPQWSRVCFLFHPDLLFLPPFFFLHQKNIHASFSFPTDEENLTTLWRAFASFLLSEKASNRKPHPELLVSVTLFIEAFAAPHTQRHHKRAIRPDAEMLHLLLYSSTVLPLPSFISCLMQGTIAT